MSLSNRIAEYSAALAATALVAATPLAPAFAQSARGSITLRSPRFVATAVKIKALDETGWDWTGSDEVHAVFADFNPVDEHATSTFGDVDGGETKYFGASENCIAPQPKCDRGAAALHFAVALWEADWTFSEGLWGLEQPTLAHSHYMYEHGIDSGDDLIGRAEVNLTQAQLVAMLPAVGNSTDVTVKPTGGSGSYRFTYRLTRLADVERTIVIHEPTSFGISLQAVLDSPPSARFVALTWTGASGANVDILRGAALIATTANDGTERDHVSAGAYQYRVCNAGSNFCSPTASVTVP